MKRVASIQDLSCIGKCSLGIALPILSAMGAECVALPTAVLSAHSCFSGFVSKDLSDTLLPIAQHWAAQGFAFDALYSGYLASIEQIALVGELFSRFKTADNFLFVDPAMADHGRLYTGFSDSFPQQMRTLCAKADFITPNITEACLLTDTAYRETHDSAYVDTLLRRLLLLGAKTVIITGVMSEPGKMGVAFMDAGGRQATHFTDFVPAQFHGTGDLFASTCVGALLRGLSVSDAVSLAANYVVKTIRVTAESSDARWYGVNFEQTIPYLLAQMKEYAI
ncbi:MAG: pyridoxamine kinase [Oscillospiraceae bacterium]|jgi:pyridoxine kinase|nr:pyridoxamine kinase [Oscillospiraceae bacterium]